MYKLDIPLNLKETAAIERRRHEEKERQGRIFNSRYRQIGVRTDHLFELNIQYYLFYLLEYRSTKKL